MGTLARPPPTPVPTLPLHLLTRPKPLTPSLRLPAATVIMLPDRRCPLQHLPSAVCSPSGHVACPPRLKAPPVHHQISDHTMRRTRKLLPPHVEVATPSATSPRPRPAPCAPSAARQLYLQGQGQPSPSRKCTVTAEVRVERATQNKEGASSA